LRAAINDSPDLSFRGDRGPTVSFSPGRIRLQLALEKAINNFPNPDVDIDASFGLAVHDGTLEPIAEQISVEISVPWWAWLIPGAFPGLAIAIDMGREDALKRMHEAIQGLGQILNFLASAPLGKRLSTVRVDDGNNGAGVIELTACAHELLRRFAEISQVAVIK
jgi:hypothetical protein